MKTVRDPEQLALQVKAKEKCPVGRYGCFAAC
jgi:hypothetical protein